MFLKLLTYVMELEECHMSMLLNFNLTEGLQQKIYLVAFRNCAEKDY